MAAVGDEEVHQDERLHARKLTACPTSTCRFQVRGGQGRHKSCVATGATIDAVRAWL